MKSFDEFKSWATREMSFALNFHEMREIYDFLCGPSEAVNQDRIQKLEKALGEARAGLEYYAKHESVIKEAYHSNDEKQITCVHTFINHKAVETLAKIDEALSTIEK